MPRRAAAVFVAFESLTKRTPSQLAHELQPVLDAGKRAQRFGDRVLVDARSPRGGGRCSGVLTVVLAGDERLRGQRIVRAKLDAVGAAGNSSKPRGTTATSASVWFSKMRSFASLYAS